MTAVHTGCARIVTLSAYADIPRRNSVGQTFEYSIVALESYQDLDKTIAYRDIATKISTVTYRIPFLASIKGVFAFEYIILSLTRFIGFVLAYHEYLHFLFVI